MISKIHPSMLAQTMFAILLTGLCSLPATDYVSTQPYFVLGSWIRTAADANMVDPLIMSGVFFSNLYSFSMVRFFY